MESVTLLTISLSALLAVFVILSLLALLMKFIIFIFPEQDKADAAVFAAISVAVNKFYPGKKITKIEEIK